MQDSLAASAPAAPTDLNAEVSNAWRTVDNMIDGFFALLPKLILAIVVFLAFWLIAKGVRKAIRTTTEGRKSSNVGQVLGRLAYFGLLVLGVLVAITVVAPGMGIGELVGLLGIGGVAIGFAFQDIFQNLLAGVLILLREPFREGDEITSGDYTGTVEKIETRATFIRTYDGKRVIIPNSQIYTDPVTVITAYEMVRSHYDIGIGYGDDIAEAKRIALETVTGIEGVLKDPAPDVLTWELAGSSVNIRVRWWTDPTRSNVVKLWDQVLQRTAGALAGAGIDLPFPTQQILFHDQTEATDGDRTRQREGWPAGPNPPEPGNLPRALAQSNG
ncbi:MAG: mechanosensitive ion channel family protein [Rhodothermales bacterium]